MKMTGTELVAFCRSKLGTDYVYGMKGKILTKENFAALKKMYGGAVWESDAKKIGRVCVDCSGLISWACGVQLGSSQWKARADEVHPIGTIKNAPVGALVWMPGHIGVYSGMKNGEPYYIAADGSAYGVREVALRKNKFTHWLLVREIFEYEEDAEMVEKGAVIFKNGDKEEIVTVEMIRKDGYTFIKTRELERLGLKIGSRGRTPVVEK